MSGPCLNWSCNNHHKLIELFKPYYQSLIFHTNPVLIMGVRPRCPDLVSTLHRTSEELRFELWSVKIMTPVSWSIRSAFWHRTIYRSWKKKKNLLEKKTKQKRINLGPYFRKYNRPFVHNAAPTGLCRTVPNMMDNHHIGPSESNHRTRLKVDGSPLVPGCTDCRRYSSIQELKEYLTKKCPIISADKYYLHDISIIM